MSKNDGESEEKESSAIIGISELESNSNIRLTTRIFEIFRILTKFLYYSCIIPYNVVETNTEGRERGIQFVTSRIRRVICITGHLINYTVLMFSFNHALGGRTIQNDPEKLFRIAMTGTYLLMGINLTRLCLKKKDGLKCLLRITYRYYSEDGGQPNPKGKKNVKHKMVAIGITIAGLAMTVRSFVWNFGLDRIRSSPTTVIDAIYHHRSNYLTWQWKSVPNPETLADVIMTNLVWKIAVVFFCVFSSVVVSIISNCCDTLLHFITLSFLVLSQDFWTTVQANLSNFDTSDLEQLFLRYREMKSLTEDMNRIVGTQVLLFMMATIPYYASNFTAIFDTQDWWQRFVVFYYISTYLFTLAIAAEAYRKVKGFPDYVYRNFATILQNGGGSSYLLKMNEISATKIGLKGHAFFTISYSFLGHVVGLLLTYIIILLQFQTSSNQSSVNNNATLSQPPTFGNSG